MDADRDLTVGARLPAASQYWRATPTDAVPHLETTRRQPPTPEDRSHLSAVRQSDAAPAANPTATGSQTAAGPACCHPAADPPPAESTYADRPASDPADGIRLTAADPAAATGRTHRHRTPPTHPGTVPPPRAPYPAACLRPAQIDTPNEALPVQLSAQTRPRAHLSPFEQYHGLDQATATCPAGSRSSDLAGDRRAQPTPLVAPLVADRRKPWKRSTSLGAMLTPTRVRRGSRHIGPNPATRFDIGRSSNTPRASPTVTNGVKKQAQTWWVGR